MPKELVLGTWDLKMKLLVDLYHILYVCLFLSIGAQTRFLTLSHIWNNDFGVYAMTNLVNTFHTIGNLLEHKDEKLVHIYHDLNSKITYKHIHGYYLLLR